MDLVPGQDAVHGGPADAQSRGDRRHRLTGGVHPAGQRCLRWVQGLRTTNGRSLCPACFPRCCPAFPAQLKLQLRQTGQHVSLPSPSRQRPADPPHTTSPPISTADEAWSVFDPDCPLALWSQDLRHPGSPARSAGGQQPRMPSPCGRELGHQGQDFLAADRSPAALSLTTVLTVAEYASMSIIGRIYLSTVRTRVSFLLHSHHGGATPSPVGGLPSRRGFF